MPERQPRPSTPESPKLSRRENAIRAVGALLLIGVGAHLAVTHESSPRPEPVRQVAEISDVEWASLSETARDRALKLIENEQEEAAFSVESGNLVVSDGRFIGRGKVDWALTFEGSPDVLDQNSVVEFLGSDEAVGIVAADVSTSSLRDDVHIQIEGGELVITGDELLARNPADITPLQEADEIIHSGQIPWDVES